MQAVAASDKALQAVLANEKAMQAVVASDKAMQAVISNNTILQKNAKTLYNTVSTSPNWVNNRLRKEYVSSKISFSSSKPAIVFVNVGGYSYSSSGQVFHPNNIVAGKDNMDSVYRNDTLDRNHLIVTFANGYGKPTGSCVFNYEIWTYKN